MKKLTAMMLALCALLTLTLGCAETVSATEEMLAIAGTWDVYVNDTLMGSEVFRADGTYDTLMDGEIVHSGTWSAADGLFHDGEEAAPYTLEDDVLTITVSEDQIMVLKRADTAATTDNTVGLDTDIVGTWAVDLESIITALFGAIEGSDLDAGSLDTYKEMLKDAVMTLTFDADGTVTSYANVMGQEQSDTVAYSVADGMLTMNGESVAYTIEGDVLTLYVDGSPVMTLTRVTGE